MGAKQSSEFSSQEIQEFRQNYTLVKTNNYDYRFGEVSLYQHSQNKQFVLVNTRSFANNDDRNVFVEQLKRSFLVQHPSVARVIGYSTETGKNICGLTSTVTIYNEFYEDDLLRELRARQKTQERYTEQEVWYLLETLVSALAFQQEQNVAHGDVLPQNVILTQNGQAKLLKNALVSQYENNFVRRLQGQTNLYLAPEALEAVQSRFVQPQYNAFKADVYALGVTLLYVTLLRDPISLYDFTQNSIDHSQVDALLSEVLQNYSFQLTDLIRQMLMQDPVRRPSSVELRGLLGVRPVLGSRVVNPVVNPVVVQPQLVQQPLLQSQQFQRVVQQPLNQSLIRQAPVVLQQQQQPVLSNSLVGRRL